MLRWRFRFGLKSLLALVALVAVGAKLYVDWLAYEVVAERRAQYDVILQNWEVGGASFDDVLYGSLRVLDAERNVQRPWRNLDQSLQEHIDRLRVIHEKMLAATLFTTYSDYDGPRTSIVQLQSYIRIAEAMKNGSGLPPARDDWPAFNPQASSNGSFGKIDLSLAWDAAAPGKTMVITITNIGLGPIKIDRELVYGMEIVVLGGDESDLAVVEGSEVAPPNSNELRAGFITLASKATLTRSVELQNGFTAFLSTWSFSDHGASLRNSPAECELSLAGAFGHSAVRVRYSIYYPFADDFRRFTKTEFTSVGSTTNVVERYLPWPQ